MKGAWGKHGAVAGRVRETAPTGEQSWDLKENARWQTSAGQGMAHAIRVEGSFSPWYWVAVGEHKSCTSCSRQDGEWCSVGNSPGRVVGE